MPPHRRGRALCTRDATRAAQLTLPCTRVTLPQPTLDKLEVNATVEQYVSNKRAQQQVRAHARRANSICSATALSPSSRPLPMQLARSVGMGWRRMACVRMP